MTAFVVLIDYPHGPCVVAVRETLESAERVLAERKAEHEAEHEAEGDWAMGSIHVCEVKP